MPKRNLQFVKGNYYHIYNRGAGRASIFREEQDYLYLLRLLRQVIDLCQVSVIAYCLLPNHYHWLLRQDGDAPVGLVPKRVFGSYTQAFNKKYDRTGTLFEGRFQAKAVDNDEYLRQLCRYIHANPVKHGLALSPELWPYSNYPEWIGQRKGVLIDRDFVRQWQPDGAAYAQAVSESLCAQNLPAGLAGYLAALP